MWYLTWILGLSLAVALVTFFAVRYEDREAARDVAGNNQSRT